MLHLCRWRRANNFFRLPSGRITIALGIFIPIGVEVSPPLGTPAQEAAMADGGAEQAAVAEVAAAQEAAEEKAAVVGGCTRGRGCSNGASAVLLAPPHQEEHGLGGSLGYVQPPWGGVADQGCHHQYANLGEGWKI